MRTQAETSRNGRRAGYPLWVSLLLLGGAVAPLEAQYPRARRGEFEVRGFDLPPDGGWRRPAERVATARRALLGAGRIAGLNAGAGGAPAVQGAFHVPVIPLLFRGTAAPFPVATYQELLFSPAPTGRPWSVATWYAAQSRGRLAMDGTVFPWVRLEEPAAYYEDGCHGVGVLAPCPERPRSRMADLLLDALDSLSLGPDGATRWTPFDNDGPDGVPNSGDDDGVVDLATFLQPKIDGACDASDAIWAHRYQIAGWNGGRPYVTRTPRTGRPGEFLVVNSYTIQSAVGGEGSCTPGALMTIGVVTHETGHAFGLPDLYDTSGASEGIGEWGLMGAGNYARPWSPASLDPWSLLELGWITVDTLSPGREVVTDAVQRSDTVFLATTAVPGVLLLAENRQRVGTDTAMMDPSFPRAKGPGLLLWLVDLERIVSGRGTNRVNTGARHGVALIQADGVDALRSGNPAVRNRGDAGDPFPGSTGRTAWGLSTTPSAVGWQGEALGVRIDRIETRPGERIAFRFLRGAVTVVASRLPEGRVRVNADPPTARHAEVWPAGERLRVTVDSLQVAFDGRSALRWTGWSDGGARTHERIVTGADTLVADFAATHRLRVTVEGPGSVTSPFGDLAAGRFLAPETTALLTAVPGADAEFLGWSGEGTGPGTTLTVAMSAPRDLVARFVRRVVVDAALAAEALLGGAPLAAAQREYLDATGNRNGAFDLGDYLDWLRRTGTPPPARVRALTGARR